MRYITLTLQISLIAFAAYLLWFLAFEYYPADPLGFQAPFVLWVYDLVEVIDTINLFIHEAGHLFFRLFGQTMYILGGSITQCLLPLKSDFESHAKTPRRKEKLNYESLMFQSDHLFGDFFMKRFPQIFFTNCSHLGGFATLREAFYIGNQAQRVCDTRVRTCMKE